jgi:nucleoside-triphosphatase
MVNVCRQRKIQVEGLLTPARTRKENLREYDLHLIGKPETYPFSSTHATEGWMPVGKFYFSPDALMAGKHYLSSLSFERTELLILDEIGPYEMEGKLWAEDFSRIISGNHPPLFVSMRTTMIRKATDHWSLHKAMQIQISRTKPEEIITFLLDNLDKTKKQGMI